MGCCKVDITPEFPVFLRGYGARNCMSKGIEERIEAGIMILEQEKKRHLLITVDSLGMDIKTCERIYSDLEKACGFNKKNTFLCCSHTHFAPGVNEFYVTFPGGELELGKHEGGEKYYGFWLDKIIRAIKQAEKNIEKVQLEETVIPVSSLSFNRRTISRDTGKVITNYTWPMGKADDYDFQTVDTQFNVWRFKAGDTLKAIIGRFSCHPVTGGKEMYAVSADYPGYFQKYVEEYFECPGFFILGSAGDVVPIQRNGTARRDIGLVLATALRLAERTFTKADDFILDEKVVYVPLRLRVKCSRKNADKLWNAALEKAKKCNEYDDKFDWLTYKYNFVNTYPEDTVQIPLRLMRLGSKVLVGMPFEVLTEIGLKLREACPEAVLTSITGGYDGYLPLAKEYKRGGYEATMGPRFNITAGNEMLKAAIEAVKAFRNK